MEAVKRPWRQDAAKAEEGQSSLRVWAALLDLGLGANRFYSTRMQRLTYCDLLCLRVCLHVCVSVYMCAYVYVFPCACVLMCLCFRVHVYSHSPPERKFFPAVPHSQRVISIRLKLTWQGDEQNNCHVIIKIRRSLSSVGKFITRHWTSRKTLTTRDAFFCEGERSLKAPLCSGLERGGTQRDYPVKGNDEGDPLSLSSLLTLFSSLSLSALGTRGGGRRISGKRVMSDSRIGSREMPKLHSIAFLFPC